MRACTSALLARWRKAGWRAPCGLPVDGWTAWVRLFHLQGVTQPEAKEGSTSPTNHPLTAYCRVRDGESLKTSSRVNQNCIRNIKFWAGAIRQDTRISHLN